ncbi:hypothetical protein G6F56_013476 [Rhizopus delemar]|nr:hypothetical protein G6F56_013476 [Rhizopus delemar]
MKIINNKQLEDVLSIDQPKKEEKVVRPPSPKTTFAAPIPTATQSESIATSRQRRRTISYWGQKATKPAPVVDEDEKRRHSSIVPTPPRPERSVSTTTSTTAGSGWAKALRRMSVWSAAKEAEVPDVFDDEEPGLDHSRKSHSSCSSSLSIRRSNELGTLAEE